MKNYISREAEFTGMDGIFAEFDLGGAEEATEKIPPKPKKQKSAAPDISENLKPRQLSFF